MSHLLGSRNVWNCAWACKFKILQVKKTVQITNVNKWNHSLLVGDNGICLYD